MGGCVNVFRIRRMSVYVNTCAYVVADPGFG